MKAFLDLWSEGRAQQNI